MKRTMSSLILAVAFFTSVVSQASAEDVYFKTQFDQKTVDQINSYLPYANVSPNDFYQGSYTPSTKGNGRNVRFYVLVGGFDLWLSGEGRLDSTGTRIDVKKSYLVDFDIGYRMRGGYSLELYPPY